MGRCCGKKVQELSEEDLADLRSIERRVKLDERPWSGKWCLRFEAIVLVYFVLMAVLMAATGAPKYETNSNHEIEGVHPWYCLLYTSPSPRDATLSRMPSSA